MENNSTKQKKPFYKRKAIMIPGVLVLLAASVFAAVVLTQQVQVNTIVQEPLSFSSDAPFTGTNGSYSIIDTATLNAGESENIANFTIVNRANVPEYAVLKANVTSSNPADVSLVFGGNSVLQATPVVYGTQVVSAIITIPAKGSVVIPAVLSTNGGMVPQTVSTYTNVEFDRVSI